MMGMDQYLFRARKDEEINPSDSNFDDPDYWSIDVGYWRGQQEIQNWFMKRSIGIYSGEGYCVPKQTLTDLRVACMNALSNFNELNEIPPTNNRLDFLCEYDLTGYFRNISDTIKIIDTVIKETNFDTEKLIYCADW